MIQNNQIDKYPDLEGYLNHFSDNDDYTLAYEEDGISILINHTNYKIQLTDADLKKLIYGKRFDKEIEYYGSCGFSYYNYCEICINVNHPNYTFLDKPTEWSTEPLKFQIGFSQFEVSLASPLFVLLFEPIYRDSDFLYDFDEFATIKIFSIQKAEILSDFTKALYYLNSSFLKKIGFIASTNHLEMNDDDPLDLWSNDIDDIFNKIKNKKIVTKPNLASLEPLAFYNHALVSQGDVKFLSLYRILEFFMNRARIKKFRQLRHNFDFNDVQLIEFIENRNEEKLLKNLMTEALGGKAKTKIVEFAFENRMIQSKDFNNLCISLYKYRNSLIHAKEAQIKDAIIPDPLFGSNITGSWITILEEVAIKIIRKYNKPSDNI